MSEVFLQACGKVNLGLDIIRRREDGYHEVDMILQMVDLWDDLVLKKVPEPGIYLTANKESIPCDEHNLIWKAIAMLQEEFSLPGGVSCALTKRIPVAAGMAGGSTDAAAALIGMNRLFELGLTTEQLQERGVRLGADVPYCIAGGTMHAGGIGEILTKLPSPPECAVLIVKPFIGVSTGFVYDNLKIETRGAYPHVDMAGVKKGLETGSLEQIGTSLGNILECVTIPAHPIIAWIKDQMEQMGAVRALMSGSGPTVFGLFRTEDEAQAACKQLESELGTEADCYVTHFCEGRW